MSTTKTINKKINILVLLLLLISSLFSRVDELTPLFLYAIIPISFFFCFYKDSGIFKNRYMTLLTLVFVWLYISSFFCNYPDVASRNIKQLVGVYILCYSIIYISKVEKLSYYLFYLYVFCFIAVIYYILSTGLLVNFDYRYDRIASDENAGMNANEPAYYMFFLIISVFLLGITSKTIRAKVFFRWLFFGMIPLSFAIAIMTGARQSLIILIPTLFFLLANRYNLRNTNSIVILMLFFFVILYFLPNVERIFEQSMLFNRVGIEAKEDTRAFLIRDALSVGLSHPILGVGPGCYYKYSKFDGFSHCSYTELFANGGVIPALLYIIMLIKGCVSQLSRYRKTKDAVFFALFIGCLMYSIYNFFYVFYQSIWLMAFFFVLVGFSDNHFKMRYQNG